MIRLLRCCGPLGLVVLLAGCLLMPGRFDSALDVRRDDTFRFRYTGEIVVLPLTGLARKPQAVAAPGAEPAAQANGETEVFTEETCTKPESGEARACTADEIAAQKKAWAAHHSAPQPLDPAPAMLSSAFGGLDPSDPQASARFAEALQHQAGWRKVTVKAPGVFEVEFDLAGRLDHDFTFPTIEHLPLSNPLVSVIRHADGTVRVETPGFGGGMGTIAKLTALRERSDQKPPIAARLPDTHGQFTLTTNGAILANNTDEGPAVTPEGQRLRWTVDAAHANAPTALIRLN